MHGGPMHAWERRDSSACNRQGEISVMRQAAISQSQVTAYRAVNFPLTRACFAFFAAFLLLDWTHRHAPLAEHLDHPRDFRSALKKLRYLAAPFSASNRADIFATAARETGTRPGRFHGNLCYASFPGGIDGKFRHFEQDTEYKLQLNLNHGLKFPLTNGSLYGRLHNHQNRG